MSWKNSLGFDILDRERKPSIESFSARKYSHLIKRNDLFTGKQRNVALAALPILKKENSYDKEVLEIGVLEIEIR
jgi:hypothetical protein